MLVTAIITAVTAIAGAVAAVAAARRARINAEQRATDETARYVATLQDTHTRELKKIRRQARRSKKPPVVKNNAKR